MSGKLYGDDLRNNPAYHGAIGPAAERDGPPPAARQLSAAIGRTFRSFDSDGNGALDLGELRAAFASMVRPRRPGPPQARRSRPAALLRPGYALGGASWWLRFVSPASRCLGPTRSLSPGRLPSAVVWRRVPFLFRLQCLSGVR